MNAILPGQIIKDRYEVHSLLGEGGMSAVYLCTDRTVARKVALKILNAEQSFELQKRIRFFREFSLLSTLRHPNIIDVYEHDELDDGTPFYSMEHVPGVPLSEYVQKLIDEHDDKDRAYRTLEILLGIAEALRHVHSKGVIHHDLKPHNILVVSDTENAGDFRPRIKLLDFGIALLRDEHDASDTLAGTLHYKAPEQHRNTHLDYAADTYAFGAIAYELCTGQKPFDVDNTDNPLAVITGVTAMHVLSPVPFVKKLHPRIEKRMNRMVHICMEKEPHHRYKAMAEIIDRLADMKHALETPSLLEKLKRKCFG